MKATADIVARSAGIDEVQGVQPDDGQEGYDEHG